MTYKRQMYNKSQHIKNAKKRARLLGRCSIYKILDNRDMDNDQKVSYIRHHYTYYDGYQSMFNDPETKKHNENHAVLNEIIKLVVDRTFDPGLLRETRECMMAA